MKKQQNASSDMIIDLEKQALSHVKSGHYKEATELYKKIWQQEDSSNEKWQQQIAYCYLQRTLSFSRRGMIKEALVLWNNYIQFAEPPYKAYDHYICWLMQAKNKGNVQAGLKQLSAQQLDKQYPELAHLLGFLLLSENSEFIKYLPQDAAFIAHFNIVQLAMQAYQSKDQDKVNEVLKQLPYRSAFRDFRTLLNSVQSFPGPIKQTLAKIPSGSLYLPMAKLLYSCTLDGLALVQELIKFSHKQRKVIAEIKGLDKTQGKLIEHLFKNRDSLSDKVKFNSVIQYKSLCGEELAQSFCHATLIDYPAGQRDFKKYFKLINKFEKNRVKALASERKGDIYDAEFYWMQCTDILRAEDANNDLKIALILRHIASQKPESEETTELLIDSLKYDSMDLQTYLKILVYYSQYDENTDDYKEWLKITIDKFPQNIEVLTQAIETALRNKTYKKATQYASKILKIDPLNTFAKETLFSSHLSHAKRVMQGKKYHLVEKEIKQAEKLNLGKGYAAQIQLMRGLVYFSEQDKKQGLKLIVDSLNKQQADPVNTHLKVAMEALLTGVPVATLLKALTPCKKHLLTSRELTSVIQQLKDYAKDHDNLPLLHKAIEKIKPALKASVSTQNYDEPLMLAFCQTLDDINAFELLRYCAKLAVARWKTPIWQYYQIYSDNNGRAEKCSNRNINRLQTIRAQALNEKGHRAMVLIDAFLDSYYEGLSGSSPGFFDDLFGLGEEDENESFEDNVSFDPLVEIFGQIPEAELIKLSKKLEKLVKKISPEQLVNELIEGVDNKQQIIIAMMQNPDLFTALMLIKAAKTSGINLKVDINDVLSTFNIK